MIKLNSLFFVYSTRQFEHWFGGWNDHQINQRLLYKIWEIFFRAKSLYATRLLFWKLTYRQKGVRTCKAQNENAPLFSLIIQVMDEVFICSYIPLQNIWRRNARMTKPSVHVCTWVKFMGYIPISIAKNLFESAAAVLPWCLNKHCTR